MWMRRSRFRSLFLGLVLEFGVLAGVPMRPEELTQLLRWLSMPRIEITNPDEADQGDGNRPAEKA